MEDGTPRRSVESDPVRALAIQLADLRKQVAALGKGADLRNASISDSEGNVRIRFSAEDAAIIVYDATGAEVARYGLLAYSDAGQFGIEALTDNGWSHVGAGVADWASIDGKPATFPADAHTHPGAEVTSAVASATTAGLAQQAEGSQYAYDNNVGGTTWYAVYVGNNGGYKFGRNTSSIRYKENVRDFEEASSLDAIRPVTFDRKDVLVPPPMVDGVRAEGPPYLERGRKDEFGFIAEEVLPVWPEVVQWFDHGDGAGPVVDGIRYEMIGARLVPHVQGLARRLAIAEETAAAQASLIRDLTARLDALDGGTP